MRACDGVAGDHLGASVATKGAWLVAGAPGHDSNAGAVYVFELVSSSWIQRSKLTASDIAGQAEFGSAVAFDGTTLVVGARRANAAYVFIRGATQTWIQQAKLSPSSGNIDDNFGTAVDVSGRYIVVGAPDSEHDSSNPDVGSAYIFEYDQHASLWVQHTRITPSHGEASDRFGHAVGIDDGTAIIGAPASSSNRTGSAYVYTRESAGAWTERSKFDTSGVDVRAHFGWSVSISQERALVTAPNTACGGVAFVFKLTNGAWVEETIIQAPDRIDQDWFGRSGALHDERALIGSYNNAPLSGGTSTQKGSAYEFLLTSEGWKHSGIKLYSNDDISNDFGWSLALSSKSVAIGTYNYNVSVGSASVFRILAVAHSPPPSRPPPSMPQSSPSTNPAQSPLPTPPASSIGSPTTIIYTTGQSQPTSDGHSTTEAPRDDAGAQSILILSICIPLSLCVVIFTYVAFMVSRKHRLAGSHTVSTVSQSTWNSHFSRRSSCTDNVCCNYWSCACCVGGGGGGNDAKGGSVCCC